MYIVDKSTDQMKKTITLSALLITCIGSAISQCFSVIPADATIVSGSSGQTINEDNVWICSDAENWIIQGDGNIWIEGGSDVNMQTNNATIYYNGSTQLLLMGSNNVAYADTTTLLQFGGNGNDEFACGEGGTVFSYELLGISDCTTLGLRDSSPIEIRLSPNPVTDVLRINAGVLRIQSVHIFNMEGRLVAHHQGYDANTISVLELEPGIYSLSIVTDQGTGNHQFVKL